jgi:hypothetical protein
MNKLKYFSLAIVLWGAANLSQSSLAQYWVPIQPPVPSHDIMFPGVRERSIDQNNEPDPTPRFRPPNPSTSSSSTENSLTPAQRKSCRDMIASLEKDRGRSVQEVTIHSSYMGKITGSPDSVIAYLSKKC